MNPTAFSGVATTHLNLPAAPAQPLLESGKGAAAEFVLTETMRVGETVTAVFRRLAARLAERHAEVLAVMLYGALSARSEIDRAMDEALGAAQWPVTWIEGLGCDGAPLAGVQVFAVSERPVVRVRFGGRVVGSVFEDAGARHCLLGGLGPRTRGLSPAEQTQQTLGLLEWTLDQAGFELADVARTWFYNDDILAWYGDFNRVRSAHYGRVKFKTGSLPASTGIGARNAHGAALTVAAWAVRPSGTDARVAEVGSPLQCPAPNYGSSFSRAMEISSGGRRRLLVSGTASIHPGGKTAWVGDPGRQVELTMEVIAAILNSRGLDYGDVTRATAYYRDPAYRRYFSSWCAERDLQDMPVVHTHCVVCRDDLLFELELDACAEE